MKKKIEEQTATSAETVRCNKCGRSVESWDVIHIKDTLGYGSRYDGDMIHIVVCNSCVDDFLDSCAINPVGRKTCKVRVARKAKIVDVLRSVKAWEACSEK